MSTHNVRIALAANHAIVIDQCALALIAGERERRRSGFRIVRGCLRCKTPCIGEVGACNCCQRYGTKSGGGARTVYTDDGLGHIDLCSVDALLGSFQPERVA